MAKSVALALAVASADAFMPALRTTGLTQSPSLRAVSRRPALVSLKAGYLDDIDPKKGVQYDAKGKQLMPDADYAVRSLATPSNVMCSDMTSSTKRLKAFGRPQGRK